MITLNLVLYSLLASGGWVFAKDAVLPVLKLPEPIPTDPYHKAWDKAEAVEIPLMPQSIAPPGGGGAAKTLTLRAIRCEMEIFFLLEWKDPAIDEYPSKAEGFADAAALQFPEIPTEWPSPFMGDKDDAVVIWRWSASAQKDLDSGYQTGTLKRPRKTADLYAFAGDSTFRTGEGAGNILSNRRRISPVENLAARGFGTLTVQDDQPVQGRGAWRDGRWRVVFRRDLNGTPEFSHKLRMPFAAAVWDGGSRERDGLKSVSVWQTLDLGGPESEPKTKAEAGMRHFRRYGCGTCHGRSAEKGIANPNAQSDPIPALNRLKEGFTREEALDVVLNGREPARKDPAGAPPPYRMNEWKSVLSKVEAEEIIDYLFGLQPAGEEW